MPDTERQSTVDSGFIIPKEPHATLMEVTPQQAAEWWKSRRRAKNRRLNAINLRQYVKDMKQGRWFVNNDAIAFDTEGLLLNGHHRLRACIEADVPFRSFVHWNLPDDSFITMDVNAKRTMADTLDIDHVSYARLIGPALNWWWRFQNNRLLGSSDATFQEEKALYANSQGEIDDAAAFISDLKLRGVLAPPLALFCLLIFRRQDRAKADEFLKSLATGANLDESNPILLFRNILVTPRRRGDTILTSELLALAFKAWNLFIEGRQIKLLSLKKNEAANLLKNAPLLYGANTSPIS